MKCLFDFRMVFVFLANQRKFFKVEVSYQQLKLWKKNDG